MQDDNKPRTPSHAPVGEIVPDGSFQEYIKRREVSPEDMANKERTARTGSHVPISWTR